MEDGMPTPRLAFNDFVRASQKSKPRKGGLFSGRLLALDPGETTGWSIWVSGHNVVTSEISYTMESCGQLETWGKERNSIGPCALNFPGLLEKLVNTGVPPDSVNATAVMESYRVYEWKTESHSWSDVPTLRIIGSMETRLIDRGIHYHMQTAQQAKNFVTDDLLKAWGFYDRGQRHSRDSMRHALFFLMFGA